jgi:hypothetical protein
MEYFLGSIITLLLVLVANYFLRNKTLEDRKIVMPTQSKTFEILKDFSEEAMVGIMPIETQATKHLDSGSTKVLVFDQNAYWIANNTVFVAKMVNNEIDTESTTEVDTMSMNKVQLEKMMFIVEQLTEGTQNDYRDSGKS